MPLPPAKPDPKNEILRLRRLFATLARIPAHRRNAEFPEERSLDVISLLRSLGDDCCDLRVAQFLPPER